MKIDAEMIQGTMNLYHRRIEAIRLAGGVSEYDVFCGIAERPAGWVRDEWTEYLVPPGFIFHETMH